MNRLQRFVAELLQLEGALVEAIEPEALEVLAPPALQQAIELPEWSRLGFGASLPVAAQRVSLESDWMERLAGLLGERGRWIRRVLETDNPPPSSPERVLRHGLELLNATYRLQGIRPAWTRYLILSFRSTALSDEKRDGILHVGFNLATGATMEGLLDALWSRLEEADGAPEAPPPDAGLPAVWERARLTAILHRTLSPRVRRQLEPFFNSMRRRQERDLDRLHTYHSDLRREALERLVGGARRGDGDEKQARERGRLEAVAREYRAKVSDLRQKYAVKVALKWIQTLELVSPVQRFDLLIKRRKGERSFTLDWNPVARRLEAAPCEYSYTEERPREVCDTALHLVSPAANGPCTGCAKPYCRACYPLRCPKCGEATRVVPS